MVELKFNGKPDMSSVLGIQQTRLEDLDYQILLVIHKLRTPTRSGDIIFSAVDIFKGFMELAKSPSEQLFCSYMAGRWVEDFFEQEED